MAKLEFEYDETGDKFLYFVIGFYSLAILPVSYLLRPRFGGAKDGCENKEYLHPDVALNGCPACVEKRLKLRGQQQNRSTYCALCVRTVVLILLWVLLARLYATALGYDATGNATNARGGPVPFDPYHILGIDQGASTKQVRVAYKKLIIVHHPDRGGNSDTFRDIAKAYKTLTDSVSRENWERYGNPDGPGLMRFGIALPKWLIEGRSAALLIAVYGLVFIVGLPVVVGTWWYHSIKYTAEKILVNTSHLYSMFLLKTPSMNIGRAVMVLSSSLEFERSHNSNIIERPSDNEELPSIIQSLSVNLNERTKERPMCYAYSVRARTLLYAHMCRLEVPSEPLRQQMHYIVSLCPMLLAEMVSIALQLIAISRTESIARPPSVETLESLIRLSALIVQGMDERKSPLCQLPHVADRMRRLPSASLSSLADMSAAQRREALRPLSTEEFADVEAVMRCMPHVCVTTKLEVVDEELDDKRRITTDSVVTATVTLVRKPLLETQDPSCCSLDRVFCPYFPNVKHEQWWIYIIDKKQRNFVASVRRPVSLIDCPRQVDLTNCPFKSIDVQLKFAAPQRPGSYNYLVCARSDSYLDLNTCESVKFEVFRESASAADLMSKVDKGETSEGTSEDEQSDDTKEGGNNLGSDDYITESD